MRELLLVFIGGGLGSSIRFAVSAYWKHLSLHPRYAGTVFPWPTFIVNILGCLLIGLFYQYSERWGMSYQTRLMLTTGLCGGFTTFSTFSYESISLLNGGYYVTFLLYVILSLVLGFAAAALPLFIGRV
ncbi:MAG: fluoride efflux transporter CrcB [Bacteroidaceae bacterium]|mgnify:CR=1 FL=1|nr:fluoride efflux transporter CrcB [Bacteroidaceae bacterium]